MNGAERPDLAGLPAIPRGVPTREGDCRKRRSGHVEYRFAEGSEERLPALVPGAEAEAPVHVGRFTNNEVIE